MNPAGGGQSEDLYPYKGGMWGSNTVQKRQVGEKIANCSQIAENE